MRWFQKSVPFGTLCCIIVSTISFTVATNSESEPSARRLLTSASSPALSQNMSVLDDVHATGEIMKKVGEFASRALWVKRGRLIFPTGTILTLAPKITVPAFRRKAFKGGLNSDFQATWYFYINCDKMGYTDEMHPFPFDRPPFYPFGSLMRPIEGKDGDKKDKDSKQPNKGSLPPPGHGVSYGESSYSTDSGYHTIANTNGEVVDSYKNMKPDTVYTFFPVHKRSGNAKEKEVKKPIIGAGANRSLRKPRSIMSLPPPDKLPGGERAILLPSIENMMSDFGFEGRGCMLRAICEIHEFPLQEGYGLLGEMIALFFSISQSPYADSHMPQYLKAEQDGKAGDCSAYKKVCARSIFKWQVEKKKHDDDDAETNEIPSSPFRSKLEGHEL